MNEKIVEVKIRKVDDMPDFVKNMVYDKVDSTQEKNFSGYAKIIYVEASPKRIKDVQPIMGNPLNVFAEEFKLN